MDVYRVYNEATGRLVAELYASSESGALLGVSWGYAGPTFERDRGGRPAMVCAGDVFRAVLKAESDQGVA